MFASKDIFLTPSSGGYNIARSVRLRQSASAYFNRTFGTPTNEKIWTWSAWVKRGSLGVLSSLFNASTGASPAYDGFRFNTSDQLQFFTGGAVTVNLVTTSVFRDPSAWYHIVLSYNATTTTVTIYVNGVAQTTTGTTVSNTTYSFNHASTLHSIGAQVINGVYVAGTYFDGYLTEINFIDGQALTPSSFGQTNSVTGVWQPIKYTGTYGTNGFYLNFSDNSAATATTIGKDYSGNGNNWTPNNISVTAGATYDSMIDVPTLYADGGNGRGNYCTLNPLRIYGGSGISNGNLQLTFSTGSGVGSTGTIAVTSGKWYWENTVVANGGSNASAYGIGSANGVAGVNYTATYGYLDSGLKISSGTTAAYGSSFTVNDVIGVALDMDAGTITFYKNNVSQGTAYTGISGVFAPWIQVGLAATTSSVNFGQSPFTYTPPTGFVALNTYNLPAGTITTSGSFTGNVNTDGPFVYLNGVPTAMTINGNAVTFGTNADKLANGFKVRSSSSSYNASGSNTYSITTTGAKFKNANAQTNP